MISNTFHGLTYVDDRNRPSKGPPKGQLEEIAGFSASPARATHLLTIRLDEAEGFDTWSGARQIVGQPVHQNVHGLGTIWLFNIAMENPLYMEVLMGKSTINGPFSMAILNYQRVIESYYSINRKILYIIDW